jgi:hypothetical protein
MRGWRPDMFALARQVQIATDIVKGGAARLAGAEVPRWEDNEATFAELQARIAKAIDFVQGFGAAQIDGSEANATSTFRLAGREVHFTGLRYLLDFVLPNLYFHASDHLRHPAPQRRRNRQDGLPRRGRLRRRERAT